MTLSSRPGVPDGSHQILGWGETESDTPFLQLIILIQISLFNIDLVNIYTSYTDEILRAQSIPIEPCTVNMETRSAAYEQLCGQDADYEQLYGRNR